MDLATRITHIPEPMFVVRAYGRASTEKQVISPLQQESACKDAFSLYQRIKPGWANAVWGGFFADEAESRTSMLRQRPVGSLVLASTKPGDVVMASNYDRIFANVMDVCETIELIEQRKLRVVVLDLDVDLNHHMGQAVFKIMAAVKELEVKEIRRRGKETAAYRIANGLPWGKPPIGWKNKSFRDKRTKNVCRRFVPDDEGRALAKQILELRVRESLSFKQLAHKLNRRGIRNPRGGTWTYPAVNRWVTAALREFPLKNGTHNPSPIPADAEHVDSIWSDN